MKSQKGITLIALVITIIVMLILVAVTITMAIDGGLFGHAKNAAVQTNEALRQENELASGYINVWNAEAGKYEMVDIQEFADRYTTTDTDSES